MGLAGATHDSRLAGVGASVRPAAPDDAVAIAGLWNPLIRDTLVTFTTAEKSPEAIAALIAERAAAGQGFLVADAPGGLAGFALYGQFRTGPGYARTMENTVILAEAAQGRGLGRALMGALEAHAAAAGVHSMIAGVSSGNPAGIAFHARLGYAEIAVLREVGYKFGRWLDLHLMQKFLPDVPPPGADSQARCR
jgi:L-amino acid N-acyltransferase